MEEYKFLLDIAIILAMTKSFSLVSKKFNMPPVVGALIAGIILGPVVLNVVSPSDSVLNLANPDDDEVGKALEFKKNPQRVRNADKLKDDF